MNRIARFLLLALVLFWAHCALAAHGIEHSFHEHDEPCIECLALPGFAAVPVQPPRLFVPDATHVCGSIAVPPAPTFARHLSFWSRAPPYFQSC